MIRKSTKYAGFAAAMAFASFGGAAQAAVVGGLGSCSTGKTDFTLSVALDATCIADDNDAGKGGYFASNPEVFGLTGWTLADKNDGGGDGSITFSGAPENKDKSGDWEISDFAGFTSVAIALKASNGFGLFLLDTSVNSGIWSSSKDLSHASIWFTGEAEDDDDDPTVAAVPLPAAGWLLLAALGGVAAVGRRKS